MPDDQSVDTNTNFNYIADHLAQLALMANHENPNSSFLSYLISMAQEEAANIACEQRSD